MACLAYAWAATITQLLTNWERTFDDSETTATTWCGTEFQHHRMSQQINCGSPFHQLRRNWQRCSTSHSCVLCTSSDTVDRSH